jgi:hypothetical protein
MKLNAYMQGRESVVTGIVTADISEHPTEVYMECNADAILQMSSKESPKLIKNRFDITVGQALMSYYRFVNQAARLGASDEH